MEAKVSFNGAYPSYVQTQTSLLRLLPPNPQRRKAYLPSFGSVVSHYSKKWWR
jgi:hypothetical protein